jgi:hypothetical protein|tara:strand:- start:1602 stop:2120 length:519 start_codon:yes stop_codon:yes gene_type:complete
MGMILNISDFEAGRTRIALNPIQEVGLGEYINTVENEYLPKLFGKELYDLFVADWNSVPIGVPTAARFVVVYEKFVFQNESVMLQSEGMKEMLKDFVYYLFLRDVVTRSSTVGLERVIGENSESVSAIQHDVTSRYNEGVDNFHTIQYYMKTYDSATYPEYKGVKLNFASIY